METSVWISQQSYQRMLLESLVSCVCSYCHNSYNQASKTVSLLTSFTQLKKAMTLSLESPEAEKQREERLRKSRVSETEWSESVLFLPPLPPSLPPASLHPPSLLPPFFSLKSKFSESLFNVEKEAFLLLACFLMLTCRVLYPCNLLTVCVQ